MNNITVSPKFQIVIPKQVRKELNINAGMKMTVMAYDGRIELIPMGSIENLEGSLKGMRTSDIREKKDRIL